MNVYGLVDGVYRAQNVAADTPDLLHRYAPGFYKVYLAFYPLPSKGPDKPFPRSGVRYPNFERELKEAMRAANLKPEQSKQVMAQLRQFGLAEGDAVQARWAKKKRPDPSAG